MRQGKGEVQIVECPRDAMQGLPYHVPAEKKVEYLRTLFHCGFHTLDCGSFVSAAAVPQLADTAEVLHATAADCGKNRLLVIIANERGARAAAAFPQVHYLGFPFSVSETFQQRNTNSTREEAVARLVQIRDIAATAGKECVVYLSMGFGNPYGEAYSPEITAGWAERMIGLGFRYISLSDTVGAADPAHVSQLFGELIPRYPEVVFGAHFHSVPGAWREKVDAALEAGCRRFDGAIKGFGGCPFAADSLTGNLPTELLVDYFEREGWQTGIDREALARAVAFAPQVFGGT